MGHSSTQLSEHQRSSKPTTPSLQFFNHALPLKLDRNNYLLWKTQMENVIFANGFEEYVEGVKQCPSKNIFDERLDSNFPHYV